MSSNKKITDDKMFKNGDVNNDNNKKTRKYMEKI